MSTVLARHIEHWPLDRLIPYARNARTHSPAQVAKIAASIRQFGFTNPILVDGAHGDTPGSNPSASNSPYRHGILAGHGRLEAARSLNLPAVPVIVLDHLSEAERRAYILADNKLALDAGWDSALLTDELQQLIGQLPLDITGFDSEEFERLLAKQTPPDEFAEYDENMSVDHTCPKCGYSWSGGKN